VLLQAISRSTQVVGRMLETIAQEFSAHGRGKRAAAWITRLGGILWGLVEVATPHSVSRLLFRHWIALAVLIGGVLFLFGPVVGGAAVRISGSDCFDDGMVSGFGICSRRSCSGDSG
jgi:hypothetical protein